MFQLNKLDTIVNKDDREESLYMKTCEETCLNDGIRVHVRVLRTFSYFKQVSVVLSYVDLTGPSFFLIPAR